MGLDAGAYSRLDSALATVDAQLRSDYPGDSGARQPVHTVYVPADRFTSELSHDWGARALAALEEHVPDAGALAGLIGVDADLAAEVLPRVRDKLATEPIEDVRIDFEDGYGSHSDDDEDAAACAAAGALAATSFAFCGLRFKSLEPATRRRGIRTLDAFLDALLDACPLPPGFLLTLPKVTHVGQVSAFAEVCAELDWPQARCGSRSRSRRRKRSSRLTAPPQLRAWCMRAAGGSAGCTTARTTTARHAGSRRRTRLWIIRSPTTRRRSCSLRRPAPECG
jgi:hypothetical protein